MIKILPRNMNTAGFVYESEVPVWLGGCDEFGFALQKVCIKTHQTILITPK